MTNAESALQTESADAIYVRNMRALFRSDPRLAQRIDEATPDPRVHVEPARRGSFTVAVEPADGGRAIYLYSKIDPVAEARQWAEAVEVGAHFCHIVSGFAIGHHVKALGDRLRGDAFLLVIEPNLALLKAGMETLDLADLFRDDRCIILTDLDKAAMQQRLESHNTLMMMGAQIVPHKASERLDKDYHAQMRKQITDHMTATRMALVTVVANSRITCKNIANNFPRYLATPPIDVLYERFKGVPAIVVSAGPSLRKNIGRLKALRDRAIIIAVQTTFKPLLEHGIRPHFVTSLDYHEISRRYFENIDDFSGIHLVAEPKASWHVIDMYRGPVSMLDSSFARICLGESLAARSGLKAGATVAHLSFYLAVFMGCEPIIFVGQDLGYTNHVYYAPGVPLHRMWRPDLNRFSTIEMKEWERLVRARKILIKTRDIEGRDIYTDEQLFTYLQQFEADFSSVPGRVIDATEGGVRKAGARIMTLKDAVDAYCTRPIDAGAMRYLEELDWDDRSRLRAGHSEIDARLRETKAMIDTSRKMIVLLRELQTLIDKPDTFNRKIAEVDQLRLEVQSHDRIYRVISMLSQQAELQRISADSRMSLKEMESAERARTQLRRDIRFVEGFIEGADELVKILNESRQRFEEAMEGSGA